MASSGKKKTTMAKIMRETKLRERRATKKARKDDRKRNAIAVANGTAEGAPPEDLEGQREDLDGQPADVDGQSADPGLVTD